VGIPRRLSDFCDKAYRLEDAVESAKGKRHQTQHGRRHAAARLVLLRPAARDIFPAKEKAMMSTVIGGAMLPHAPQFFTMPETENKAVVAHVREVAADIGRKLRALSPDLWIIFSNDHAEQFFHTTAPPFTVHVGGEATGEFAGRKFQWKIPSEIGFELVRQLYRQNFDPAFTSTAKIDYAIGIPLTHLGHTDPVLPIYVNAYLPPQPTMERCYGFGQAVARTVTALGLKTVILSSGGMSHFPGTDRYGNPELGWDRRVLEKLAAGNLKALIGFDEAELDQTGNIELRCWACAAGALGERKPEVVSMDPSWHHNYASLAGLAPRRSSAMRRIIRRSGPSWWS
jgi:2,3-dihydroxyphenylpropionate 1,2-dioxygenase